MVSISSRLADRAGLEEDLAAAPHFDVLLTELKAAAVDVAARRALATGAEVVFVANRPRAAGGDGDLDDLLREGLVADAGTGVETPGTLQLSENRQTRRPFEMPTLEKYTDMQDLVLIDPVHQVDEAGWPRRPDAAMPGADA